MLYEFRMNNESSEISRVRHEIEKIGTQEGLSPSIQVDLQTVVDEILSNIVNHGYEDNRNHEITISVDLCSTDIKIVFVDDGIPFNPVESGQPDVSAPIHERSIGGLGIHFVKHLVDEIRYRRHSNHNYLTIVKSVTQ